MGVRARLDAIETAEVRPGGRAALIAAAVACGLVIASTWIAPIGVADRYDPVDQAISSLSVYGLGATILLVTLMVALGVACVLVLATFERRSVNLLGAVAAGGFLVGAVFRPTCAPAVDEACLIAAQRFTLPLEFKIHLLAVGTAVGAMVCAMVLSAAWRRPPHRSLPRWVSLGAVAILVALGFLYFFGPAAPIQGMVERLLMGVVITWLLIVAAVASVEATHVGRRLPVPLVGLLGAPVRVAIRRSP